MAKKRSVPLRKCIVSKEMHPKDELIRIVRNKEGLISVDPSGKMNGRGAYLMRDIHIIEQAEKNNVLNEQFKTHVDPLLYDLLKKQCNGAKQ